MTSDTLVTTNEVRRRRFARIPIGLAKGTRTFYNDSVTENSFKKGITKVEFKSVHPATPSQGPCLRMNYFRALLTIGAIVASYSGYSGLKTRAP